MLGEKMLVEKVEKEQSNSSSVEFKIQIIKEKIEKILGALLPWTACNPLLHHRPGMCYNSAWQSEGLEVSSCRTRRA